MHTSDELAFELQGQAAKVVTAPTLPSSTSNSNESLKPSRSARQFAETFTKHLPVIAAKLPIFAELQNMIVLSVVAELMAQKSSGSAAADNWQPDHFLKDTACSISQHTIPSLVPSIANYRYKQGRHWIISISGGVEIRPRELTGRRFRKKARGRQLTNERTEAWTASSSEQWWWDKQKR